MKLNVDAKNRVIRNLRLWADDLVKRNGEMIDLMESKHDVTDVISLKKDLLVRMIRDLPLTGALCYFCVARHADGGGSQRACARCEYGKIHGICSKTESSWKVIKQAVLKASHAIDEYWKDDKYRTFFRTTLKTDAATLCKLTKNLKSWNDNLSDRLNEILDYMEKTDTVESLMNYKKDLVLACLVEFPISHMHCYFCIRLNYYVGEGYTVCHKCQYGKIHGVCGAHLLNDTWSEIKNSIIYLRSKISNRYYNGESYESPPSPEEWYGAVTYDWCG